MANRQSAFKVIIAGGSVAGLVLANALEKAGIDYLVLEKREIAPNSGASIGAMPHTANVFDQLGVWDAMLQRTMATMSLQLFDEHGRLFEDSQIFEIVRTKTKRPAVFMERREYLRMLYDNLPAEARRDKVRDHAGVASFREDDDGVTVVTEQGDEIRGSILVGADGVHSQVRGLLADTLASTDPTRARGFKEGFVSTYRCVFAVSKNARADDPSRPFVSDGKAHKVFYRGLSGLAIVGPEGSFFWFMFIKEDAPSTMPHCPRYSDADAQDTIKQYGHLAMGPGYTFGDLWEARVKAMMVPLEEGIVAGSWNSGGRVVLMGDAVVKPTPNMGLGANTHVEGVCHLVNELYRLRQAEKGAVSSESGDDWQWQPTTEAIQGVFQRYEDMHRPRATSVVRISGYITRFDAMDTWYWRLARVVSPWVSENIKASVLLDFISKAPVLEFLPRPEIPKAA